MVEVKLVVVEGAPDEETMTSISDSVEKET